MDLITWGFIINALIFIGGLFKMYTDMQVRFKEVEVRLSMVEKQDEEIYNKLDKIMDAINDIKLDLKDKADK